MNAVASEALRRADAEVLSARSPREMTSCSAIHMHGALAVFLLDPRLRVVLDILDPKAVEQARAALGL